MTLSADAMEAIPALIAGFVLACLVTLATTPLVRAYARRRASSTGPKPAASTLGRWPAEAASPSPSGS